MNYSKIGTIEGICLIVIIIFNHIVFNLPQSITNSCGSSSILNILYISFFMFILILLIIRLFKNFQTFDILDIAEYLGGNFLKYVVGISFSLFLIFTFGILLRNFSEILKIVYFPYVPTEFIIVLFLFIIVIVNYLGKMAVIKTNTIITPLVALSLIITFLLVSRTFSFERIFPILGYGVKETFFTGLSNLFGFNGICYLFFIMPYLEKKENFKKIGLWSVFIISIFLLLAIGSLLLNFSFIKFAESLSPVYLIIKTAKFGTFIQRPEAFFILTWILSLLSYLSVGLMFLLIIFQKLTNIQHEKTMGPCFATFIYIAAWIPIGMADIRYFESILYKYSSLIILFGIFIPILILSNIKYKHQKNSKKIIPKGGEIHEKLF